MVQSPIPISSPHDLFPFGFKYNQSEILDSLTNHPKVMLHASTGYGKTILSLVSMLYHLLKPHPSIDRVFIFVRTKTQIFRFLEESATILNFLSTKYSLDSSHLVALPLIGKEELCVYPLTDSHSTKFINCKSLQCKFFLKDYQFFSSDSILLTNFLHANPRNSTDITSFFQSHYPSHCPYYIIRSLLKQSKIVVTTHAWLIQPKLFSALTKSLRPNPNRSGIIIDEAHNFKASIIDSLSLSTIESALCFASDHNLSSTSFLRQLAGQFQSASFLQLYPPFVAPSDWRLSQLQFDINSCENNNLNHKQISHLRKILDFFSTDAQSYFFDSETDPSTNKQKTKTLNALIAFPSHFFEKISSFKRIILMSGTFIPLKDYARLYGLEKSFTLIETAPLNKNLELLMFVDQYLTSKYSHRSNQLYSVLSQLITELHSLNPHHTLVFSSSKEFSNILFDFIIQTRPVLSSFLESDSAENQIIINKLKTLTHSLIFASFGGSFSEGIEIKDDITNQSKISLIIFTGLPLPAPTQQQIVSEYLFTQKFGKIDSNQFLYALPIYQMVLQAAGRGIRQPTDRCALVILDFRLDSYNLFPKENIYYSSTWINVTSELASFFHNLF